VAKSAPAIYIARRKDYAARREMIETHHWLLPTNNGAPRSAKATVLYWLIIISFKFFGVNAALQTPGALAVVARLP